MMQHPPDKIDAVYKEMQITGNIVRYGIVAKIYDRCQRAVFMPQPAPGIGGSLGQAIRVVGKACNSSSRNSRSMGVADI